MQICRLSAACRALFLLALTTSLAPRFALARTAAELADECAWPHWDRYMQCQQTLLAIAEAGNFCVPRPLNGARHQIEFVAFYLPAVSTTETATAAAQRYFAAHYPCE